MNDLWDTDHKVLASIGEQIEDQGNDFADTDAIAELLGPEVGRMDRALRRLWEAKMIRAKPMLGGNWVISGVTERGLREIGAWPSQERYVDQLTAALEEAAAKEPDPVKRSKLRSALTSISEVGHKTVVEIVASYAAKMSGAA